MDANIGDPRLVPSVERAFEVQPLPGFWGQVTLRAMLVSALLSVVFCFVTLRIHMTIGLVPSLALPTGVLSFFCLKWLITLVQSCGITPHPFTRQENVFAFTSITTCINVALTGGFATYIVGMTCVVARSLVSNPDPGDIVPHVDTRNYMLFLLLIGLAAVLVMVPFKQIFLIDYRLLFPSGTVAAHLVNSFHTPEGAYVAKLQVATLLKTFIGSFSWSIFQWFFTAGSDCGFEAFPTFGLDLYKRTFYFDFSATYIGVGMICPYMVNLALLFGGIISWGFLYPYIESKQGIWYEEKNSTSLTGLKGYKVFLGVTMILTDGIFNFLTIITTAAIDFYRKRQEQDSQMAQYISKHPSLSYDDRKRIELFISNQIPPPLPVIGYILCATISAFVIPQIFNQIHWYHIAALYTVAPILAFSNGYGTGLTDWSAAPTYSQFTVFVIAAWIANTGAVVASLVACGIITAAVHVSSQTIQDFKTGYMTLTQPRVMLTGQIFGVVLGSIINPSIYYAFQHSVMDKIPSGSKQSEDLCGSKYIPIGSKQSEYPCPYAGVYRAIGIIGMGGVTKLPKHCVTFCMVAFFITIAVDFFRLVSQKKGWTIQKYIPSMTAIAMPFFTGAYYTVPMCVGSIVLFVWNRIDSQSAELLSSAVAAGLISGEGLFALPTSVLSMNNVQPPICMKFLPSKDIWAVDQHLSGLGTSAK